MRVGPRAAVPLGLRWKPRWKQQWKLPVVVLETSDHSPAAVNVRALDLLG